MATTYETLRADIITAMKARDSVATTALRTADAAIKRAAMEANKDIDEALVIATIRKAVKNLADAKTEFAQGGRADLVAANEAEIKLLEKYLPAGLDAAKVEALVAAAIQETGAQSKKKWQGDRGAEEAPGRVADGLWGGEQAGAGEVTVVRAGGVEPRMDTK